ncbi:MAG: M6 family metalloprotease domain-containing protein [Candidatus Krumholzibacteria bacterium]
MKRTATTLLMVTLLLVSMSAFAQIAPPAPGVEMPQSYYDAVADDPTAFQFKNAWIQKAQRAREAREAYFSQPGREGLSLSALPGEMRAEMVTAGTVFVPVILCKFSNTGPNPFPIASMQARLFDPPPALSMTALYDEMSYGNVLLTGTVFGWVALTSNDNFYEGPPGCNGLCGNAKTGFLITEAIAWVDPGTDFGQFDNDGPDGLPNSGDDDGFVDFIAFVHPETGGECGGTNMWSHRWVVQGWSNIPAPITTNDPRSGGGFIRIQDYTLQPALGSLTGCGSGMNEIGVFAHEFGHAFGLPDLYDTNGGGQGIGHHGLMASGNWRNPPNPTHMSPWSKVQLGWLASTSVDGPMQNYNINNVEVNAQVFQLNIMEEKFNRKTLDPISGTASLHCGVPGFPASQRNWIGGAGYGNNWDEAVRRHFTYDGSNPVTLQYDASWDTEATYDFGRIKILVNGTTSTIVSFDGVGSATGATADLTPFLSGTGATEYHLIAEFTSDIFFSDEDGNYLSGPGGPFKLDNISVTGGGESYFSDFEVLEDGWCYDFTANPNKEFFLVENRNKTGAAFDQFIHGDGLYIWHIEQNVNGNTSGSPTVFNLQPALVTLETADNLNELLLGGDRGDPGDMFPGSTNNTAFTNATSPNSKSYNTFLTNVVVQNISAPGVTMTADMVAGRFPPTLTAITPNMGDNDQVVPITDLAGTWLYKTGTFALRSGVSTFPASNVGWVAKSKTTGDLDLNGLAGGLYDVVWTGPDGQEAVLASGFTVNEVATGIGDVPFAFNELRQNHPNPFNPTTTISYSIQVRGHVALRIYNAAGQLIRTLVNETQTPRSGGFNVVWDGRSNSGAPVASGVYLYKLTAASNFNAVKKLVLLK